MYELQDSKTGGGQSTEMFDDEDPKSHTRTILVVVVSVGLLFAFVAVLVMLAIGSPHGDGNVKDNGAGGHGEESTGAGIDGGHIPASKLNVEIQVGTRGRPSMATVLPSVMTPRRAPTPSPTHPAGAQSCPADGYYGKRIGRISTYAHAVSGFVYAATESIVVIKGLNYDGTEPAAHFWAEYKEGNADQAAGDQIPDENGSNDALKPYTDATVHLKLPKAIAAYQSLGIYSPQDNQPLGNVFIPSSYEPPKEQNLGKPRTRFGDVMANEVVLTDSSSMVLRGFTNDGQCPSTYFVAAPTTLPHPEELTYLSYDGNKMGVLESYNNTDVTVELPPGCHWSEFKWFSVFCMEAQSSICDIDIDTGVAERLPLHNPESVIQR